MTVTHHPGQHGQWVDTGPAVKDQNRYHITRKHHKCSGPHGMQGVHTHIHGQAQIQPEVQDAMQVLLAEPVTDEAWHKDVTNTTPATV
mmetsp:Transcript_108885/g.188427  ORF Transcript_108885/g.188427 Transcript_108885/m.188427 type:complete len:88 (+) Transcript_108885:860-1123(+)